MTDDGDLRQFGVVIDVPPPLVYRQKIVESPTKDKICGFLGYEKRRGHRAYTTLRGGYHYYGVGGGFAISDSILDLCEAQDVARIYVHDRRGGIENGDIHEFTLRDYRAGESITSGHLEDESDPQTYIPLDDRRHLWEKLGNAMYVTRFETACDRSPGRIKP